MEHPKYDLWPDTLEANEMLADWEGTPLSFWREQRGLTQQELADASGMELHRVQLLELDAEQAEPDEAASMATALRVAPSDIRLGDDMLGDSILPD
jgi:transcriptional regulator with XRE-family HTH domain